MRSVLYVFGAEFRSQIPDLLDSSGGVRNPNPDILLTPREVGSISFPYSLRC